MGLLTIFLLILPVVGSAASQRVENGGHVVTGHVRDEQSNTPLQGVQLQITGSGLQTRPSVVSNSGGEFQFTELKDGDYSVVASKPGYISVNVGVTVLRSGAIPLTILLHRSPSSGPAAPGNPISVRELHIPERAQAAFDKGRRLLEEQRQPAEAIAEFQRAIQVFPDYYEAYTEIGIANFQMRKPDEAERALSKSIELSASKSLEPLYLLADLYNSQRKYAQSEPLARQAVALNEDSWNAHFELARALVGLSKVKEAEVSARRACELQPNNAPARLVLGNAHLLEANYPAAIEDLDIYLNLEPNGPLSAAVRQNRDNLKKQFPPTPAQESPPPKLEKP
jgi:Tfp pilus assembly protein PilF